MTTPQLKYPVDKCFDFMTFHLEMNKQGLDITDIPTPTHGTKQIERNKGNFYNILIKMDPIFPKLTSWKFYSEKQKKEYKKFGIPYTEYRYNEYESVYELPIKYDSSGDYANWVEKKIKFFEDMKTMKILRGKKWTADDEKLYEDNVDFGTQNNNWFNIVLDKLYQLYPQYYENGKIRIWHDEYEFDNNKEIWDYPLEKSYFISELEEWISDTFSINTTGFYEWILDSNFIERRYWNRVWNYDISDENFRNQKAPENIVQINALLKQIFKTDSIPVYIDYHKEYKEDND